VLAPILGLLLLALRQFLLLLLGLAEGVMLLVGPERVAR
jgi:hypothetical protein